MREKMLNSTKFFVLFIKDITSMPEAVKKIHLIKKEKNGIIE